MSAAAASPRTWRIASSTGRFECAATLSRSISPDVLVAEVRICGDYWDRHEEALNGLNEADLVREYTISLDQVVISRAKLMELREKLRQWLVEPQEIGQGLSGPTDQTFDVSFGGSEELISSVERPVCMLTYEVSSMKSIWRAVVDQTCIREFCEGVATWLD